MLTTLADKDFEGQLRVAVFRQELQKLGWIEGRNIRFEYRWAAGDAQRLRAYAEELVGMAPAVMLAANNTSLRALEGVTRTVPIVFAQVADPVGSGHVASLARPGGNITGFALYEPAIAVKWLELLKEIAPSIARVAIIYDPTDFNSKHMQEIEAVIASFGVQLSSFIIRNVSDIERAIDGFSIQPHGGLIILPGPFTVVHRDLIISLAIRHALPNVHAYRYYPAAGGLASYGVDNVESYLGAASYVDRILKGEKPADLPVQLPKTFRLVINLKSAKALGLDVPPTLLARAIRSAVQWVVSTGGSASVSATTRAATSGPSGGMREGRVLSCRRPSMPSVCMNRSCQRQTQVFDLPVRRMISLVPTPSALERMIAAPQACFCDALRSLVIASSRPRTDRVIVMEIPCACARLARQPKQRNPNQDFSVRQRPTSSSFRRDAVVFEDERLSTASSMRARAGWRITCAVSGSGPRWWWGCTSSARWERRSLANCHGLIELRDRTEHLAHELGRGRVVDAAASWPGRHRMGFVLSPTAMACSVGDWKQASRKDVRDSAPAISINFSTSPTGTWLNVGLPSLSRNG